MLRLALNSHNINSESHICNSERETDRLVKEFGVCQRNIRHPALNVRMSSVVPLLAFADICLTIIGRWLVNGLQCLIDRRNVSRHNYP